MGQMAKTPNSAADYDAVRLCQAHRNESATEAHALILQ